jgi:hypothetical protein
LPKTFLYQLGNKLLVNSTPSAYRLETNQSASRDTDLSRCAFEQQFHNFMGMELFELRCNPFSSVFIRGMQLPICVRVPASAGVLRSSAASSLVDVTHITGPGPDYGILSDGTWLN